MDHKIPNYILTHRKRWALTQKELAGLLGAKSETQVSRWERSKRKPSLRVVLASQVIFGETPDSMFPLLFSEIEESVMHRAYKLYTSLAGSTSKKSKRKLKLLEDVLRRAIAPRPSRRTKSEPTGQKVPCGGHLVGFKSAARNHLYRTRLNWERQGVGSRRRGKLDLS